MTEEEKSALGISNRTYKYTLNCVHYVRDAKSDLKSLSELHNNSNGLTYTEHIYIAMLAITNATCFTYLCD